MRSLLPPSIRIYFHPKILVVLLLGFSSGLPRLLVGSTLSLWLLDHGLSLASAGLFAYASYPYSLHFVWAPFMDRFQPPWLGKKLGNRRSWMVLTQLLLLAALVALAFSNPEETLLLTALLALLVAFLSASQDVVVDAFRTEYLDPKQYGEGATMAVLGYRIGMLVAGAGALFIADAADWQTAYLVMAGGMGVGLVTALLVRGSSSQGEDTASRQANETRPEKPLSQTVEESPRRSEATTSDQAGAQPARRQEPKALSANHTTLSSLLISPFAAFRDRFPAWAWLLGFVLFYRLSDGFIGFITLGFFDSLGFTKTEIATAAKLVGTWALFTGMFVGGAVIARKGLFTALWLFAIAQLVTNLAYVVLSQIDGLLPDANALWFALTLDDAGAMQLRVTPRLAAMAVVNGLDSFSGGMVTSAAIAFMMRLCQDRTHTATQYALLSSLASLGSITLAGVAGWVAKEYSWTVMFTLSAFLGLPCLAILWARQTLFRELAADDTSWRR